MKRQPTWFKLSPADFLADHAVERMTMEELGLHCYLLMRAWIDGGVPASLAEMGRYAMLRGISARRLERLWQGVKSCWVPSEDSGRLVNPALDAERQLAGQRCDAKSRAGKASADKRQRTKAGGATRAATREEHVLNTTSNSAGPSSHLDVTGRGAVSPAKPARIDHDLARDQEPAWQRIARMMLQGEEDARL